MTARTLVVTSLLLALVAAAPAQTKKKADDLLKHTGDWEVEVLLKNDAVFRGVVLDDRFVEQPFRAEYKLLDDKGKRMRRAGIRIWYYNDLLGYLFLPYKQIKSVKKVKRLTKTDIDGIKANIAKVRETKLAEAKAGRKTVAKMESADRIGAKTDAMDKLTAEERKLLEEFAPKDGWTPELYSRIQSDSIMLGTELTAEQKKWSGVYPEWLAAYEALTAEPEKKTAAKKAASPAKTPETSTAKKSPAPAPKKGAPAPAKKSTPEKKPMTSLAEALKAPSGTTVKKKKSSNGRGLK